MTLTEFVIVPRFTGHGERFTWVPPGQTPFVQLPVSPKATLHGIPTKSQVHPALRLTRQALPGGQAPSHSGKVALPQGVLPATHSQPFAVTAQIGASGGHSPQQSGGGALPGSPHGTGTNVVVVVVLVVVVVVGTQTVLSAAQAARTCCTHCWLHFVLAFPLKFLQPAVAWHASIPSPQTLRRHGGEAATAEAVSTAATARSTNLVSIFRAVIVPRLQRAPAASSSRLTLLPVAVREQLVRA